MTTPERSVEEIVEEFASHIPKPEQHYPIQADWKDWQYAHDWLTKTLQTRILYAALTR